MTIEYNEKLNDHEFCLREAIMFLKGEWKKPSVGFVACFLEDHGRSVATTNTIFPNGMIVHAENRAISQFESKYGKLGPLSKAIVTLSPCIEDSPHRIGPSCSSILFNHGVTNIHFGIIHEKQGSIETYTKMGFNTSCSSNLGLSQICNRLLDFYVLNKGVVSNSLDKWATLKSESEAFVFNGL